MLGFLTGAMGLGSAGSLASNAVKSATDMAKGVLTPPTMGSDKLTTSTGAKVVNVGGGAGALDSIGQLLANLNGPSANGGVPLFAGGTKDTKTWLIIGGVALLAVVLLLRKRSTVGLFSFLVPQR